MTNNWNDEVIESGGRDVDFGLDLNPFHLVKKAGKLVQGATQKVGGTLSDVPVIGSGLHAIYDLGPAGLIDTASKIASGARIDKAVIGHFKNKIKDIRDVAPYAQTVVSFVPGIGQGVSGAIGAASALSRGQPISTALVEGVEDALPGGPVSKAALHVALAAVQGKPIDQAALETIPIAPEARKYLVQGVMAAKDIAMGKRVDSAIYDRGKSLLPPDAQKAVQVGVALGHAKNLQDVMKVSAAQAIPRLIDVAKLKIGTDKILSAGVASLKGEAQKGFLAGSGLVAHKFSPTELTAIRQKLSPEARKGLDLALSTHLGRLKAPLRNKNIDPKIKLGYYATHGVQGAKSDRKEGVRELLIADPSTTKGVVYARVKAEQSPHLNLWQRIKLFITGK